MKVLLKHKDAKIPTRATSGSVGYDVTAVSMTVTDNYIEYDTGIIVIPTEGYYVQAVPRSSITKKQIILKNGVGIIDPDFRGTVKFRFSTPTGLGVNEFTVVASVEEDAETGDELAFLVPFTYSPVEKEDNDFNLDIYNVGDKIGQLIITKAYVEDNWEEIYEIDDTTRQGGFGSTGA